MGDSYIESVSIKVDLIRLFLSLVLDRPAYGLLSIMYQIFFNVASADLFSNETIMKFYGRVQLILGVFMMFQLAMIIIKGIVNPDSFFGNDKGAGAGNLIMRVCTALFMLTILVPINIPSPKNEYETQLNNNGLLFGTLYSLQYRLLSNNTLGRLILGTNDDDTNYVSTSKTAKENLKTSANIFTSTILKGFYRINLIDEDSRTHVEGKSDDMINSNRVCQSGIDDIIEVYKQVDVDPQYIISMVNKSCTGDVSKLSTGKKIARVFIKIITFGLLSGDRQVDNKFYVFAYNGLVSAIVAFVFAFILLSFTIDVAVRAIKLAVLRLIAPIPIISYMDPKGSKDGAFNSWVKTLTSTYLDLFVRLAVVYFVIFLIQEMMVNGIIINNGSGVVGVISYIIIWIGLFVFAKQAPKFFRKVLGLKEDGGKFLNGLSEAMGAAAVVSGTVGSFNASRQASRTADMVNGNDPNTLRNMGKHLLSGIAGGIMGGTTGMNAWMNAKDHQGQAVMDAIQKRNATVIKNGGAGSTFLGRTGATIDRAFHGDGATAFDAETRAIAQKKDIEKSAKDLFSYLEGKGKTDGADYNVTTASIDLAGGISHAFTGSLNEFNRRKEKALANFRNSGNDADAIFTFDGQTIDARDQVVNKIEEELAYAAGDQWATTTKGSTDSGFVQKRNTYNEAIKFADDPNGSGLYVEYQAGGPHTASRLKKTSKAAGGEATSRESAESYKRRQANYGASKRNN